MSFMPPERHTSNTTKSSFMPPEYRTSNTAKQWGWMNKRTLGIGILIAFGLFALFSIISWIQLQPKVGVGEYGKLKKHEYYWDECFLAKSPEIHKKAWDLVSSANQPANIIVPQLNKMQDDGEIMSYYRIGNDAKVQVLQTRIPGAFAVMKIKIVDDTWPFDDREWYVYTECVLPENEN